MHEKLAVANKIAKEYRKAGKKRKGEILDHFCHTTGYHRKYAIDLLTHWNKTSIIRIDNKCVRVKGGELKRKPYPTRSRKYDEEFQRALIKIWELSDFMCGKRLCAYIQIIVSFLRDNEEFHFTPSLWEKLVTVSAATVDRILKPERKKYQLKGRSHTKPGTLLKHHIPIKTYAEWTDTSPGFLEIDLVGHEGGNPRGDFCFTLTATDVATQWTYVWGIRNKAQKWTVEALDYIINLLPFPVLGIDCDNGSEFINAHLARYCEKNSITFTRSRPYKKNDGCYVEQKNDIIVRRTAGYLRYDTEEELKVLNHMYECVWPLVNFFHPSMKLIEKTRIGSTVKKKYDAPQTPYQRVLASPAVSKKDKHALMQQFKKSSPETLQRKVDTYRGLLQDMVTNKNQLEIEFS
jgi:hypothetical protein